MNKKVGGHNFIYVLLFFSMVYKIKIEMVQCEEGTLCFFREFIYIIKLYK